MSRIEVGEMEELPKDDCDLSGTIVPVENALGSFTGADGSVILRNRFHWVTATAGSAGLS
jgi:hypothetical protein